MLRNLVVENYALISKLEIDFRKGLTIITGETGAGKSILLGALSLILGKRSDTSVLYNKEKKCIVEGTFDIKNYGLSGYFEDNGIDYEDLSIIRREISPAGKSRAFVNDVPVNLELLTELSARLIDIHSQHQNLNLADNIFQMKVLDSYAGSGDLLNDYKKAHAQYRDTEKKVRELTEEAERSRSDLDYLQFQYTQLEEAKLSDVHEQVELELEAEKLSHAEEIKTVLTNATHLLQGENASVLQQLKEVYGLISKISRFLHGNETLPERIDSSFIELKDVTQEIEQLNDQVFYDPERLAQVNDRLNVIYNLEKKHRIDTVEGLISLRNDLKDKIGQIASFDSVLSELNGKLKESRSFMTEKALMLSEQRKRSVASFENHIVSMLHDVGIPNAGFSILLEHTGNYTGYGADSIRFLFSANRNAPVQDISRVASGGEISRLMLCIKSLMSDSTGLPTIIFDEIDTGVSGEIAERVGNIIRKMADKMQIINITHLPQVASKGQYHYLVYKTDDENTTVTRMKLLSEKERHLEIAKMLSGEKITEAALENAKALINSGK